MVSGNWEEKRRENREEVREQSRGGSGGELWKGWEEWELILNKGAVANKTTEE